ncbi:hypothetical protein F5Y05DRAFT_387939 [Hypoxylon sp. FL0543]|nr:hypothetical protein F5Y05DRAFT_387939 [Hypoxylon sp. FL0543]
MPPYAYAQVLCTDKGFKKGACRIQHIDLPRIEERGIAQSSNFGAIRGLSSLLASREEWLTDDAITKALEPFLDSLPRALRNRISLGTSDITGLFEAANPIFESIIRAPKGSNRYMRAFQQFKATEWTLWPINYGGNHWELVVIHKEQVNGEWSHVLQLAIIDAWKNDSDRRRREFVDTRVRRLLRHFDFTFAKNFEREVWVPWQKDFWSCGLRTYWSARQIVERILKLEEDGLNYDEEVWSPLSGWFNPDFVRWEMIGLNAYHCVKDLDYRARIAVELVNHVDGGNGHLVEAERVMRPPATSEQDERIERPPAEMQLLHKRKRWEDDGLGSEPGQASESTTKFVPVPVPNQRRIAPSWAINRRHNGPLEREDDDPVWSRTNTGRRRVVSQQSDASQAPKRNKPNLFSSSILP